MDLLGPSLEDLFCFCGRSLSLETVLMIGRQLISQVSVLHSKGFLHLDIKPENTLIRLDSSPRLCLVDLGQSTRYLLGSQHYPLEHNQPFHGSLLFSSPDSHLGRTLSR